MRRQLPAYSPLSARLLVESALKALIAPNKGFDELRAYLGERFAADEVSLFGSGTDALRRGLEVAAGRGAIVALPAYSCYDLVTAAVGAGCRLLFYDVDPSTFAPDLEGVRSALAGGAEVVVAGSLYGFPLDWPPLQAETAAAGAILIEDCAQGIGASSHSREGGSNGDLTVLSFGRGKGWTGGGGGALLTRGARVAERLDSSPAPGGWGARSLAASVAQWALSRPSLFWIPDRIPALHVGETRYVEPRPVIEMALVCGRIVRSHAGLAAAEIDVRRRNAGRWRSAWVAGPDFRYCTPISEEGCAYLRQPFLAVDALGARLDNGARVFGVARGYPRTLTELPASRPLFAATPGHLPGAIEVAARLWTLPTHSMLDDRDIDGVLRTSGREH